MTIGAASRRLRFTQCTATWPEGRRLMSNTLNYNTAAELFAFRHSRMRPQSMKYRRFDSAAEAIRFAIEVLPADLLLGVSIEVGEERFDHQSIRRLYLSPDYPLPRGTRTPLQ